MGRTDIDLPWEKTDKVDEINYALYEIMGTALERVNQKIYRLKKTHA